MKLTQPTEPRPEFKRGDRVVNSPEYENPRSKDEEMIVLGDSVWWGGLWWTPLYDPREGVDPSYQKAASIMKV